MPEKLRLAIAGGGTGGHLYPALAVVEALQNQREADWEVLFFGTPRGLEAKVIPELGYRLELLEIRGLARGLSWSSLKRNWSLPWSIWWAARRSQQVLEQFQPHVLLATGGYVAGLPTRQALKLKIPVVMQEQNAYPGLVTRRYAARAHRVFVAYEACGRYLPGARLEVSGNPIRLSLQPVEKAQARAHFQLEPNRPTLLIMGGSQGAQAINRHFLESLPRYLEQLPLQVLWQTGASNYDEIQHSGVLTPRIRALPFIGEMAIAYSAADIVVSRAGATALAEIAFFGLPSILIPLPTAAANHQEYNARVLVDAGAAFLVLQRELSYERLFPLLQRLLSYPAQRQEMGAAARKLARPDAARIVAQGILEVAHAA